MQGWQIQTVFEGLHPVAMSIKSHAANLWRGWIACRTHHTTSPSVSMEAKCNLSYTGPSFVCETQRVIDHHVQHPPPYPSTQHSTQSNILHVGTVTQRGMSPSAFYFSCSLTSADLRWGQDPRKLGIIWFSLKLLHFLKIFPLCELKSI